MPEPVVTAALAKDWIGRLWKLWSTIRTSRRDELRTMADEFGDPEQLARRYIEPDCQRTSPADVHEDEAIRTFRQPVRQWLNRSLRPVVDCIGHPFFSRTDFAENQDVGSGGCRKLNLIRYGAHGLRSSDKAIEEITL